MRIVFIGTVEFSYNALNILVQNSFEVVGVISSSNTLLNSDFKDLTPICEKHKIPIKYVSNINSIENIEYIKSLNPDVIYCFGWSRLIRSELLNIAPYGVVGFHPAELPKNRGRHPIIWALVLGLTQTGSTFFFMDEGADSGDILSQKTITIEQDDNARSLYDKITQTAVDQILGFTKAFVEGKYERKQQNHSLANVWRKRSKKDGKIDFRMSAMSIYNLVRALTNPYLGAHYEDDNGSEYKVWECVVNNEIADIEHYEYGKVIAVDENAFTVKCGEGAIKIIQHEFETIPKLGSYL